MDACRKIQNLVMHYAELIDGGDFSGVAELLKDCTICSPIDEGGIKGYQQVLDLFTASTRIFPDTGTPRTKHVLTNLIIELESEVAEVAFARSYYTVFQGTDQLPFQPIVAGRYHDEFEKIGDAWKFSRRNILVDFIGDVSQHLLVDIG